MQTRKANAEAIRKRRESISLNDDELSILRRRDRIGLSQAELSDLIAFNFKKGGFSEKTIWRCEAGNRVAVETLIMVTETLRMSFDDGWVPDGEDDVRGLLDGMRRFDQRRDYAKAEEIGSHLLQRPDLDVDRYGEICIAMAIMFDHDERWEDGLALLNDSLSTGRVGERYRLWACYQTTVLCRNYAHNLIGRTLGRKTQAIQGLLDQVRAGLKHIIESGGTDIVVAANHQLCVLQMIEGNYEEALGGFRACLTVRENAPANSEKGAPFRRAYEHRRMALCYAQLGRSGEAKEHFEAALELARLGDHKRVEREVLRDLAAWAAGRGELQGPLGQADS